MGSGNLLLPKALLLGLVILLLSGTCLSNVIFGQVTTPTVKIISPSEGGQINQGNGTLTIRGISSDNSTSNCEVSIILNDVKPYQSTLPVKAKDYSSWTFSLSSSYNPIKEGQNKATAKISCMDTPVNNMKWYSINFIGMTQNNTTSGTSGIAADVSQNQLPNKNDNMTGVRNLTAEENQIQTMNKNINVSNAQISSLNISSGMKENASSQISNLTVPSIPKQLSIGLQIAKNPILTGSLQTANVSVSDSSTGEPIQNATVGTSIMAPSGKTIKFEHTTSSDGKTSFSWIVPRIAEIGLTNIKFDVSAAGYNSNQTKVTYEVTKN